MSELDEILGRVKVLPPENVPIEELRPHPRNYRAHPEDQLEHLEASMREAGFYRNVVVARDGTILAGHGVVEAARRVGLREVPVVRIDAAPDDPRALKVLVGDNELARLSEGDDRALTEMLKEVRSADDLLGTGFTDEMLAALAMVTRPVSEIRGKDEAAEWVGMPDFEPEPARIQVVLNCDSEEEREKLIEDLGLVIIKKTGQTWSSRWPPRKRDDLNALIYEG